MTTTNEPKTIIETLKENRPNLSLSSYRTYTSILRNLLNKLDTKDLNIFKNEPEKVIKILKDTDANKRKTILSAIIVFIEKDASKQTIKKYRDIMIEDVETYKKEQETQEKTDKQKENWMSYDEVLKVYNELKNDTKHLFKKTNKLTNEEFQQIQNFVILSCMILIPPRRLLDWTEMKVKNINESTDNYIKDNKIFVFNKYKTSKFYGSQEVEIPIKLRNILKKYLKINTNDFLFIDRHNRKLYPTTLNQRLNRIFDRNLGVSMLRHIYISDNVLKDIPKLDNLKKIAKDMGHSTGEQILYKKFD
jgi:hypothetical protein